MIARYNRRATARHILCSFVFVSFFCCVPQTLPADPEELSNSLHSRTLECSAQRAARRQVHHRTGVLAAYGQPQQKLADKLRTHETGLPTAQQVSCQRYV